MLKNKNMWLILIVSAFVIITVFGYVTRAIMIDGNIIAGYLVLMDQKVSTLDYEAFTDKNFETIIYLPSESCTAITSYCSFIFPTGVDESADITNDGRIDGVDIALVADAYGCTQGQTCWDEAFTLEDCYFTYSDRQFKDPTEDCKIDSTDINLVSSCYGQTVSLTCNPGECCKADVNKDYTVDVRDVAIVGKYNGEYADVFKSYGHIKKRDVDLNNDGEVDIIDVSTVARNYGEIANKQKCGTGSVSHVSGNQYKVQASGKGLYYIGVSYFCEFG